MIRTLAALLFGVAALALTSTSSVAEEKAKEGKDAAKELKGDILCGKCELKESKTCAVAIRVKDGEKTTVYWFDADSSKKYHADVCTEVKKGTVKGTVKVDGKKNVITVKELKYD